MKALITGACGFLGTNMVEKLSQEGCSVVGIDSFSRRGTEENLIFLKETYRDFVFKRREIEDFSSVVIEERPDIIFHFAAQVAVTSSIESPQRDFRINAEGTFLLCRTAQQLEIPVIYTSTNKVYGDNVNKVETVEEETRYDFSGSLKGKGLTEDFSIDAKHHTPYGISKLVGELYVREFGGIANRCSCMYGPHQFGIVDQGWISHIAKNQLSGLPTTIYGDGKQVRDALHISDVVDLFWRQAQMISGQDADQVRGEVYNVGGGYQNTISVLELCQKWGIKPRFENWRPADQKVFYCDTSKAMSHFGWAPQKSLDDGLAEIYEWTRHETQRAS